MILDLWVQRFLYNRRFFTQGVLSESWAPSLANDQGMWGNRKQAARNVFCYDIICHSTLAFHKLPVLFPHVTKRPRYTLPRSLPSPLKCYFSAPNILLHLSPSNNCLSESTVDLPISHQPELLEGTLGLIPAFLGPGWSLTSENLTRL